MKKTEIISTSATGFRGEPLSNRKWEEDILWGGFSLDFPPDTERTVDTITCPKCEQHFI